MSGQRQATRPLARRPAAALESQRVSSSERASEHGLDVPAPLVGPTHFALHCRRRHSPSPTPPFLATLPRPCLAISSSFCFSPQASTCSPRRRTFASPPLTFPHAVTPPPLQPHRASSQASPESFPQRISTRVSAGGDDCQRRSLHISRSCSRLSFNHHGTSEGVTISYTNRFVSA